MLLARLYLQLGTFLDHWTGTHGLSAHLRGTLPNLASLDAPAGDLNDKPPRILSESTLLFPQFGVDVSWPPCFLVHGAADTAVPVQESVNMARLLERADVPVILRVIPDQEHSFDYAKDAETLFGKLFDEVERFIVESLSATTTSTDADCRLGS